MNSSNHRRTECPSGRPGNGGKELTDHHGVGENPNRWASDPGRPLSRRAILLGGVLGVLVAAAVFLAVQYFYGGGTERDRAGLEVVRTAGTLVVGLGGVIALLLTARRQRFTELTLVHQREVAAATERDAAERRITELYTRAVDQLGNDKAPVRLGGLHALERLAQSNPDQRQTIVDVICAYLRMPYTPPADQPPAEDAPTEAHIRHEERRQELQVRLTAQRILGAHLRPEAGKAFWGQPGIDLDLTQAYLHTLDLTSCHVRTVQFDRAQFAGDAGFNGAHFAGAARFSRAHFDGDAVFDGAHFHEAALFDEITHFDGDALFHGAHFDGNAVFSSGRFGGRAIFHGAHFNGDAWFPSAQFGDTVTFYDAQFSGCAELDRARVGPHYGDTWPAGWTTRDARAADREEEGWMDLVRDEESSEQAPRSAG